MALAESVKRVNPNAFFLVCLVEREVPEQAKEFPHFDRIVLAKDLGSDDFDKFIFRHSIVEASTAVKGQLFRYVLDNFHEEDKFVYLDPDILVFSELREVDIALDSNDIVLTPHLTSPECKKNNQEELSAVMDNELSALKHGVYNLGFLGIRRSTEALRFIDWWATRLKMFCYNDIPNGIFTDQKWIDLAPGFFPVYILKHPGYNVAPWNLSMRTVKKDGNSYFVNGEPLRFFHFSGWDSGANEAMVRKYVSDSTNPIYFLRSTYIERLEKLQQNMYEKIPWSYGRFFSGEKIRSKTRVRFRCSKTIQNRADSPFSLSNIKIKYDIDCIWDNLINYGKLFGKKIVKGTLYKNKNIKKVIDNYRFKKAS
jgi:hypothetical protein